MTGTGTRRTRQGGVSTTSIAQNQTKVTIVYDDHSFDPKFKVGSGFACLLRTPSNNILFDTGGHGPTLLHNLDAAAINPLDIDIVVMSHLDSDHSGGLFDFLAIHADVRVHLLKSLPNEFKHKLRKLGASVVEVARRTAIAQDIYAFGHTGNWLSEQSLAISTPEGVVLLVADAHPGILEVIKKARRSTHGCIDMVLGGFHLEGNNEAELWPVVAGFQRLGVTRVAPCHSTGELATRVFKSAYGSGYFRVGVGTELQLKPSFSHPDALMR